MHIIKLDQFEHIYQVDKFEKEYRKLFGKSKKQFQKEQEQLLKNLYLLDDLQREALQLQQFEALAGQSPLCSIRHVSKTNPRIIFVFANIEDDIILLSCTLEKGTVDYDQAIERAKSRWQSLEED